MARHRHTLPPRRPPLPFELDDGTDVHGIAFVSGDRWMLHATDELQHAVYEELRRLPTPVSDPLPQVIGRAMVRWLN